MTEITLVAEKDSFCSKWNRLRWWMKPISIAYEACFDSIWIRIYVSALSAHFLCYILLKISFESDIYKKKSLYLHLKQSNEAMSKFNEATRVQMPAMVHLTRLGYSYFGKISEDMAGTVYDPDTNILTEIFREQFYKLNP